MEGSWGQESHAEEHAQVVQVQSTPPISGPQLPLQCSTCGQTLPALTLPAPHSQPYLPLALAAARAHSAAAAVTWILVSSPASSGSSSSSSLHCSGQQVMQGRWQP